MELFALFFIIFVVSRIIKAAGSGAGSSGAQNNRAARPGMPGIPPQNAKPFAPPAAPTRAAGAPFTAQPAPFPPAIAIPFAATADAARAGDSLSGAQPLPMNPPSDELCDDGWGSLEHTSHEGEEFHADGAHGITESAATVAGAAADVSVSDERAPELLGEAMDAAAMRRAVIYNEILNRRGGRGTWQRS